MAKIVYILGAGFSAPLGIPLIRNFLSKAKDLYFTDPSKYPYFENVFRTIRDLHVCHSCYKVDLHNIEDILSLLEMTATLTGSDETRRQFTRFIIDVISSYTPTPPGRGYQLSWQDTVFGQNPWGLYGLFVASILNHSFKLVKDRRGANSMEYDAQQPSPAHHEYAIITLNYDLLLESIAEDLNNAFQTDITFRRAANQGGFAGAYAKLHGSIDTGTIVPPTWNKTLGNESIVSEWKLAHRLLTEANHIRIIGYSLPTADVYVQYLLRSAAIEAEHLKSIHVICRDSDQSVEARYKDLIRFPNFTFRDIGTENYLDRLQHPYGSWPPELHFHELENVEVSLFGEP